METSSPRMRTYEIPKPDTGLAEWTSKIKALQRQVDADEEAEQQRLEEEISAFRAARLRRSQGIGYGPGSSTLDASKVKELAEPSDSGPQPRTSETFHSPMDRQKNHDDALSKLTAKPTPARAFTTSFSHPSSAGPSSHGVSTKPEPMSLAQFMGGRATGPRLNRHMPQQDAHDPTQFEQRTRIDAPHPVFGRGGVALPGLARPSTSSGTHTVVGTSQTIEPPKERDRRPMPSRVSVSARVRTMSTPSGPVAALKPVESSVKSPRQSYSPSPSISVMKSPVQDSFRTATPPRSTPSPAAPVTPRAQTPVIITPSSPPPKSVSTPSLARPILPDPKPTSQLPNVGASASPSPAFLKIAAQKEPTPSISRLQGRGFVQSMVQASSQIEARTPSPPVEKSRPGSGSKRASVLDRWQPNSPSSTPSSPPPVSPKPVAMRKSKTLDPSVSSPFTSHAPLGKETPPKALRNAPSLQSLIHRGNESPSPRPIESMPPVNIPGLGSATTMVIYKEDSPTVEVDELGVRRSLGGSGSPTPAKGRSSLPAPSGKPLAHPTRDRAKLPRKNKGTQGPKVASESVHKPSPPSSTPSSSAPLKEVEVQAREAPPASKLSDLLAAGPPEGGPRRVPSPQQYVSSEPKGMVGARALPGLAPAGRSLPIPPTSTRPVQPEVPTQITPSTRQDRQQQEPLKHVRIPSTGNRATVMDVAQAFNEHTHPPQSLSPAAEAKVVEPPPPVPSSPKPPLIPRILPPMQAEKRKSSYERYSAITLPPLPEETTPTPTPAGSLIRHAKDSSKTSATSTSNAGDEMNKPSGAVEIYSETDEPLPLVDVAALANRTKRATLSTDFQTISVDVIAISGNTSTTITQDPSIFYDSEVLAVVHRCKVKSTGLVSSTVWGWQGKRSQPGEKEENKLHDFARRYGTALKYVHQYREPSELVHILGGQMIIRQGTRAHWSAENTCMHLVRLSDGVIFIDELDLNVKSLCSGFSYCLSILDTLYVWHGRGSPPKERQAALDYAHRLSSDPDNIHGLVEGENDDDEMFWLILGSDEYARADYWRWRRESEFTNPRVWSVNTRGDQLFRPVLTILEEKSPQETIFLIDCIWEFFVLVGRKARGRRRDIRLAVSTANDLSALCAKGRPFAPPVHALVLPTQFPCDLLLSLRGVEESWLNEDDVPDHMNIVPYDNALEDLSKNVFDSKALQDHDMLPLGVDSSDLP
ncbi:Gelsolin-like domain-containing protein [Pleurotus pulmonarius]